MQSGIVRSSYDVRQAEKFLYFSLKTGVFTTRKVSARQQCVYEGPSSAYQRYAFQY